MNELLTILELENVELDIFRGFTPDNRQGGRIYGGQVVAQALAAAYRTVENRVCHSLHSYFIRAGDPKIPILLKVERVRDGGTFSVRRVVAIQHGQQIFNLAASFQVPEEGFEHQFDMPPAPEPDGLRSEDELRDEAGFGEGRIPWPIDVRPTDPRPWGKVEILEPHDMVWFRARESVGDDVAINQCALAYGTDMTLLDTSLRPHDADWASGKLQVASLDHALWFHRHADFSQWHLYVQDSPSASGGRGFNRGAIYDQKGRLIASATQEALIRHRQS